MKIMKKWWAVLAVITALIVIAVILLPGYTKLQDLIAENNRLEERIKDLSRSVESLKSEKERLETDILYIEKVAREKLGVVREDEIIIKEQP